MYVVAEKSLYALGESRGLGAFAQFGTAESDQNLIDQYFGVGLSYYSPFQERPDDVLSIGLAFAHASPTAREDGELKAAETAFELTYHMPITGFLSVQPDIQYIQHPGLDPANQDAWVIGLRTELAL
jgi:porin